MPIVYRVVPNGEHWDDYGCCGPRDHSDEDYAFEQRDELEKKLKNRPTKVYKLIVSIEPDPDWTP